MDLQGLLRFPIWIFILGSLLSLSLEVTSQTGTVSRTTTTSSSRRITISRTRTTIIRSTQRLSPGMISSDARPCRRPPNLAGLIQFITVDQNANITESGKTFPAGTIITHACQDPGRTRLVGPTTRTCILGVWTAPAPTCETTRIQFGLVTTPPLPRSPTNDGSFAIYLTPYATSVDIACFINQGRPELVANHISNTSPRTELYDEAAGGRQVKGMRITSPVSSDGGTFTCVDSSRTNEMHSIDLVFDDQRYALRDPCPSDVTVSTDDNSTHTTVSWDPPSLVTTLGIRLLSYYEPGNRFNLGKTDVVYNASDILGIVEVCVFTITVLDTEPPNIMGCPEDLSVPTDRGRAMAQVSWSDPTAVDNSGQVDIVTKALVGTYYGIGSFEIVYTATDLAGNEATCSFSIAIEDRELPQLTCPENIVVDTIPGASYSRATWTRPTSTDNSGRTITLKDPGTEGVFIYGISNRTYSVQDDSGNVANCTFSIRVRDSEPPRFMNCPRNIRRYIETYRENTTSVRWEEPIADDNVGISWPWYRSHTPGTKFAVGDHRISYVVNDLAGNNVTCDFEISIIEAICPSDKVMIGGETFTWPSTMTSTLAESAERCPVNTAYGGHPVAIRYCQFDFTDVGLWQSVKIRSCGRDITPLDFRDLSKIPVSKHNVKEVARYVEAVVVNQTAFEREDIMFLSDTLQNMADVESPSKTVSNAFVEIVDQVAESDLPASTRDEVGHELGTIIQTLGRQLMESAHCDKKLNIATASIAVRTASFHPDDVTLGLTFAPVTSDKDISDGDEEEEDKEEEDLLRTIIKNDTTPMLKHLQMEASIQLPSEVFEVAFNGSAIPVSFVVFKDDTLFPSERLRRRQENYTTQSALGTTWPPGSNGDSLAPQSHQVTKVLGPVLSASVAGGMTIINLSDPVVIEFGADEGLNYSNIECVFWDFGLDNGRGDWSNEGCQFAGRRSDGGIICYCNHLTNFAVLVDIHGQLDINPNEKFALDIITRIGCFLSIAGLSFTILTFLLFKTLRTNRSRQILIHLCFALLILYVVFICGIVATRIQYACMAVAALLHYLVLVTVMWMGVEARHMYVMLVKVFKSERSRFVIKAALVAWGIPVIPVAIAVGLSTDSYRNEAYCFLMPSHVMYYGLLLPIGVILLHNIITFSMAIRNLLCSDMSGNSVNKTKREQVISRLQNAVCMSVLLGLTWSFGFLAVGEAAFAFRLLFCLFNSFQGFIIFALFCVRSKEVRSAWSSLSIIECNIRSQSYRVKEKSYHANSESAWNGPCVIDWGDAPGLDAYMQSNKQRFRDSANSDESRIATYSVSASALNTNNKINNGW